MKKISLLALCAFFTMNSAAMFRRTIQLLTRDVRGDNSLMQASRSILNTVNLDHSRNYSKFDPPRLDSAELEAYTRYVGDFEARAICLAVSTLRQSNNELKKDIEELSKKIDCILNKQPQYEYKFVEVPFRAPFFNYFQWKKPSWFDEDQSGQVVEWDKITSERHCDGYLDSVDLQKYRELVISHGKLGWRLKQILCHDDFGHWTYGMYEGAYHCFKNKRLDDELVLEIVFERQINKDITAS